MEETLRRLGKHIRDLRIKRGWASQEVFAEHLGMHRTFVGHLETGRKDFRLTTMIRVAETLGVRLSELFRGMENDETGTKSVNSKVKRVMTANDLNRVLDQAAALERTAQVLKNIAMKGKQPSRRKPSSAKK